MLRQEKQLPPLVSSVQSLKVTGPRLAASDEILTDDALDFVADLIAVFQPRLDDLLARRKHRRRAVDVGQPLTFLEETRDIREADWQVGVLPPALLQRHVEITGPVDRKMIINALNSGADVFMADFEDSCSPTWDNILSGQLNLRDAVMGDITFVNEAGKQYRLRDEPATLMVRPRGLHLVERHVRFGGKPIPAALFDFGLYFHHNAERLLDGGKGPFFYLPKLESHLEARWWNDVFLHAQDALGIEPGTIKATVLIETLPAAFQMDEILYELREHSAGLNCGRWDYIFSFIKTFRNFPDRCLPDRSAVTMMQPFMRAYTQLVVKTCHRRGVHAMGGMAAQIPIKSDAQANELAMQRVREDKLREVRDGHDGTWVAHPGLVPLVREIFQQHIDGPHQLHVKRDDVNVNADDLVRQPAGPRTEEGLRHNIRVGVQYLAAWLGGNGCVPLYNLMEDAATAEISRAQVWQWLRHGAGLDDGRTVTQGVFADAMQSEMALLRRANNTDPSTLDKAASLFERLCKSPQCAEFLTTDAYEELEK